MNLVPLWLDLVFFSRARPQPRGVRGQLEADWGVASRDVMMGDGGMV